MGIESNQKKLHFATVETVAGELTQCSMAVWAVGAGVNPQSGHLGSLCPESDSAFVDSTGGDNLITAASLRTHTSKDLAQMAKKKGVQGWHSMRKEQLIRALVKLGKQKTSGKSKAKTNGSSRSTGMDSNGRANGVTKTDSQIAAKIREDRIRRENLKDLALSNAFKKEAEAPEKDRLVLVVRDSYWMQAYWEITKTAVRRAKAALSDCWHTAKPVLRVLEVSDDGVNSAENIVREIEIHGGVRNWYIDVPDPPKAYRVALGYLGTNGRFHMITRSNLVTTPIPSRTAVDHNWTEITEDYEKFYAMSGGYEQSNGASELQAVFEEKIRRPMQAPSFVRLGTGMHGAMREFDFEVDAHMVIYGATDPAANVTLGGEPVKLQDDGTFAVRMNLPDRRQVLPVVASSRDGTEQRTTVLAIERNTKVMEPVTRDTEDV